MKENKVVESEGISTLVLSNTVWKDNQPIKKAVKNITELRTQNKWTGFKKLLSRDEGKQRWVIAKNTDDQRSNLWKSWKWKGQERPKVKNILWIGISKKIYKATYSH